MTKDPARWLTVYRVVCLVLVLMLAGLGQALRKVLDERENAVSNLTWLELHPAPSASAKNEAPALTHMPAAIEVHDISSDVADLTRAGSDKGDQTEWLFSAKQGGIALVSLGYRHLVPLHIHDATHEADLALTKGVEIEGKRTGAGDVAYFPPYAAHRLVNRSRDEIGVVLSFLSAPAEGPIYLDQGDDRLQLAGHPAWMRGQLERLVVSADAALEPLAVPAAAYVVSGQGALEQGPALAAGRLIIIPAGAALRVKAAGEPLVLLRYAPGRDGVGEIVRKGAKLYSQDNEEPIIRDFFHDRKGGVFLDVGAGDYKRYSTTYYLEERLGWSGVSVDARAELAQGYREHRPRSRFVNYLVTDKARGPQKFYRTAKIPELSSISEKLAHDQILHYLGQDRVTEVEVPTITLNELLAQLKVDKIDFLSMDIEEHEPEALAGFDVERYRPELVCIEVHQMVRDRILSYFTSHGYERQDQYLPYDSENWYFARRP